jgi:predicted amidohydrolase YtcJ
MRLSIVMALFGASFALAQTPASLIVVNARVHTLDARVPAAEALAVAGDRVIAVGTSAAMRRLAGPSTRVIDAHGQAVVPAFNDAHVHFLGGGFQLASVDLRSAASREEFARRLAEFAKGLKPGRWITGGDWDHELWPGAELPRREWIDAATPATPVFVSRLDGHMALANSLALKLAGVTRASVDPPGGLIVRDPATGEPTGVLKDAALGLVEKIIPAPSLDEKLEAGRRATRHAASLGVASVQDMSAGEDVRVYQLLLERGELLTRVYAATPASGWERVARLGVRRAFGSPMLRIGALKAFADGSLGSTTAYFYEPYNDAPDTRGLPSDELLAPGLMERRILGADAAGLQLCIHAIGDCANAEILDLYEKAIATNGARDRRFRIEHSQHLRVADIQRFAKLGVIASMQPYHLADDGRWAEKRIGAQRAKTTYAFRSLLDAGVTLAFGSDWTVAPLDPLAGIRAAVTRRTLDGRHPNGWVPEEKITVEEALRGYTTGSARAEFAEADKGTLEPGKLADFVVLSHDILTGGADALEKARVEMTVVGGRVVYSAAGLAARAEASSKALR